MNARIGAVDFPLVVEKDKDGAFIVSVPSMPGCHTFGYTMEEAMGNIREALALCLEVNGPPESTLVRVGRLSMDA